MALFTDFFIALFGTGYYATKYAVSKGKGYAYDEEIQKEIREKRVKERHREELKEAKSFWKSSRSYEDYQNKMKKVYYIRDDFPVVNIRELKYKLGTGSDAKLFSIVYASGCEYNGEDWTKAICLGTWLNDYSISDKELLKKILLSLKFRNKIEDIDFIQTEIAPYASDVVRNIYPDSRLVMNVGTLTIKTMKEIEPVADAHKFYKELSKAFTAKEPELCRARLFNTIDEWSNYPVVKSLWRKFSTELEKITRLSVSERRMIMVCHDGGSINRYVPPYGYIFEGGCKTKEEVLVHMDKSLSGWMGNIIRRN